jgi:hypothetical protein
MPLPKRFGRNPVSSRGANEVGSARRMRMADEKERKIGRPDIARAARRYRYYDSSGRIVQFLGLAIIVLVYLIEAVFAPSTGTRILSDTIFELISDYFFILQTCSVS